jgi:hypothetical protein
MNVKLHHGRILLRQRMNGRYVTIKSVRYPVDMAKCQSELSAAEMAAVQSWSDQHLVESPVQRLPVGTTTIMPVYVDHVVQALEVACGLACAALAQQHVTVMDRRRIRRAARRLLPHVGTDDDSELFVISDVPEAGYDI